MKSFRQLFFLVTGLVMSLTQSSMAADSWFAPVASPGLDPTQLQFHRLAVRRFIFSNNLPLSELVPSEIVAQPSMHPTFIAGTNAVPDTEAKPELTGGNLLLSGKDTTLYVGGVNPYATYELDVRAMRGNAEVAVDLATLGLGRRVQVASGMQGVVLRLIQDGKVEREQSFAKESLVAPYLLQVQLSGTTIAAFVTKDGETRYLSHTMPEEEFSKFADFRDRKFASQCTFNVAARLPDGASVTLGGARSYLSAGVGQADIRMITHKDGAPFWENNRLWFTFSARGLGIHQSAQGVLSLNPSVFDPKFEGMIVYDHGDGLLRNDYASQIIYEDDTKEWLALGCDFGGVAGREGRGASGLVIARSAHDPRRGFSVMGNARQLGGFTETHEDPCLIYDAGAKKWRLATCCVNGFHTELFEADNWDGPFTKIAGPTKDDSTGVLIQKIGDTRYVFSGSKAGPMLVYSYPDLKSLGELKLDLPQHGPQGPLRTWPNLFPLPAGFPHRYMMLTMDRPNFPGVKGKNWSYGALYLFGADTSDISNAPYEFPNRQN
jgi:hypothetical protein